MEANRHIFTSILSKTQTFKNECPAPNHQLDIFKISEQIKKQSAELWAGVNELRNRLISLKQKDVGMWNAF